MRTRAKMVSVQLLTLSTRLLKKLKAQFESTRQLICSYSSQLVPKPTSTKWVDFPSEICALTWRKLVQVQETVQNAKLTYESERRGSKVRKLLVSLSQRIHSYSRILDVIAQRHPEYVALTWGTVKFLLMVNSKAKWYCILMIWCFQGCYQSREDHQNACEGYQRDRRCSATCRSVL
jgi:hypothetical protein